ncbi:MULTISPECIES: hypothetical protein [Rufibacter]|uniref:DUF1049 domain-containing protein n=1 Tax=Rufibacter quisquiliarum TaxID=1549639 RepID=A0A839GKY0_9BACT|nr:MULTISPECIES: hypothetical protein [Rufibacter]MBA9079330.1 hypothetical protein [Rufibacter quisquiliarum]
METLKKIINIAVMAYLIIALLFLLRILSVDKFVALFDMADAAAFYRRLLWAGVLLLLAELLVENAYIATLKRGLALEHRQLTELKAKLYDQRLNTEAAAQTPAPPLDNTVPPPAVDPTRDPNHLAKPNHHRPLP